MRITIPIFSILLCLPLWIGCTAITSFDDYDFSSDGDADGDSDGDADGDSDGDADGDGDCDPVDEICNGEDDDCDDEIDEDFDLLTDENNCGACDRVCPHVENGESLCINGDCTTVCDDDYFDCDDNEESCETNIHSAEHCGDCDTACDDGEVCTEGDDGSWGCANDCGDDEENCDGLCVNINTNPNHCGECDNTCEEVANATPSCVDGECFAECDTFFGDCNGEYDDGCEQSLTESIEHCGGCDEACPVLDNTIASCSADGTCEYACQEGYLNCDTTSDDCEASMLDSETCGACDVECTDPRPLCSRTPTGTGYECVDDCADGLELCGDACVDLLTDPQNCLTCGHICPTPPNATPTCLAGECNFDCWEGFENCDGRNDTGCDGELGTFDHCSECNDNCDVFRGFGRCEDDGTGTDHCVISDCDGDWGDCDDMFTTGCEELMLGYLPDLDDDNYGSDSATVRHYCADLVPANHISSDLGGDCDDSNPEIHPSATELCNEVDDNCRDGVDESFPGMGDVCGSSVGECERGTLACIGGVVVCDGEVPESAEVCDGLDNDCDGENDNGFECALGTTMDGCTWSPTGDCSYVGFETCNLDCTWSGFCEPYPEGCNRIDDNCDGFVDEDVLEAPAAVTTAPASDCVFSDRIRGDFDPIGGNYLYGFIGTATDDRMKIFGIDTDGGSTGSSMGMGPNYVDFDICFDGNFFVLAYITDITGDGMDDVVVVRISQSMSTSSSFIISDNTPLDARPATVRCAHVRDTSGQDHVAIAWIRTKTALDVYDRVKYTRFLVGGSLDDISPSSIGTVIIDGSRSNRFSGLAIEPTHEDQMHIAYARELYRWSPGDTPAEIMVRRINLDGDTGHSRRYEVDTDLSSTDFELAYSPSDFRAALVYQMVNSTGPTGEWRWILFNSYDLDDFNRFNLGTHDAITIANAGDSSFGLLSRSDVSGTTVHAFERWTTDGGSVIPSTITLDRGLSTFLVGIREGSERYGAFGFAMGATYPEVRFQPIRCP